MERSRSKRNYYYDQDYDSQTLPRTKQRYHHHNNNNHHYSNHSHNRRGGFAGRFSKPQDTSTANVSTSYRILCHDIKAGGVIGKSGSIIKAIRQDTGAWINVHPLIPGDEERIIEISDASHARRRDPDGRNPSLSPAREALLMIHERILESDAGFGLGFEGSYEDDDDDDDDYGPRGGGGNRVATRLVVSRIHVGCLLGKGGKIIEQMRMETKTQIRILPRDHNLPRCVSMSEEIVQVVGDVNAVKKAVAIISERLKESQLRDRSQFRGRLHSPDRFLSPDDDFTPPMNNMTRRSSIDGTTLGPRSSASLTNVRSNTYAPRPSGTPLKVDHAQPFTGEDLVFRILCPNDKVDSVMGESDGIIEMLRNDIGVDVRVSDPVLGSDEQIIIITSEEGPDDDLFPSQEALLHIQSQIVDLGPDKDNVITTRLLVPSSEIGCLEGEDGSLSEMRRLIGANIQILPREELPVCVSGTDELVQIVGEIRAARDALVEVTLRLRSYLFREISFPKDLPPPYISAPAPVGSMFGLETASPTIIPARVIYEGSDSAAAGYQNTQTAITVRPSKDFGGSGSGLVERNESDIREDAPSVLNRISVPLVTRSTLEVVIPEHAILKLIMRSGNKLAQISELSGASVTLVEDRPEVTEKVIQISGTPEQAERAQSLLQGFILSTQEDVPPN
ncbi:hypothetical protein HHK36_029190 [Tetracentron sinense]|uniref:K Homology domain-containing protein n=1 Tax=Tetracentron sinense TaxID=13715 RepID=A0A834YH54_TETSI|nr:hypothetical protein HHK36_029190 [Tetracentron sinense]